MSRTDKEQKAWEQRQEGGHRTIVRDAGFDGRRYGNKRKAVAETKVKDRRRQKRAGKQSMETCDPPLKHKHFME
jgi:hypothetical protein